MLGHVREQELQRLTLRGRQRLRGLHDGGAIGATLVSGSFECERLWERGRRMLTEGMPAGGE